MAKDYRNTKYCRGLNELNNKKSGVVEMIKIDYPRAVDMHAYICRNDAKYKNKFIEAYNYKCSYCGVSIDLIPKSLFEVDHYIFEKSSKFKSKRYAGFVENLVLACHDCNHKKSSFDIPDNEYEILYPDHDDIKSTFERDEMFYINISELQSNNQTVKKFYDQVHLGSEVHRLDYLLMNLIGLQQKFKNDASLYSELGKSIELLRKKRNMI